jgi:D-alanyl-D-alanine carboxypeptidase/D-alanyl-D-alanine-endopeptidase (penicillin-binding protein 4)
MSPSRILALVGCFAAAAHAQPRPVAAATAGAGSEEAGAPAAAATEKRPPAAAGSPSRLAPAPTGTPAERARWLAARIDEILAAPSLAGAKVGVQVAEVDSGRSLYAKNDATLYNPASNAKLVTTASALALLGPEYRWKTVLYAESVKAGEVQGDLYLKGFGDPSLVGEDLWKMVADLSAEGVKKISGDLAVDDSFFDEARLAPGFEQKSEDLPFRAPNGAVSLNYNACAVHVLPSEHEAQAARVVVEPQTPYFAVVNEARTVAAGRTNLTIAAREAGDKTEIKVGGRIRAGEVPHVEYRRVAHPDLNAGWALRELLGRRGIKIGGKVVHGVVPPGARPLVVHYSQPLGVQVRDVNKRSNNFMAEQLLKTMGAETGGKPGTWPKGVDAVGRFLESIGVPRTAYKMVNGSGLYDSDRFTAAQLVALLRTAYRDFRYAADFVGSLALAGADGTIGHRMEGGQAERYVRAKTGSLAGVSCLSGYAGGPGRAPLAFSILMNDVAEPAIGDARRAQDAIAEALVVYLTAK